MPYPSGWCTDIQISDLILQSLQVLDIVGTVNGKKLINQISIYMKKT